MQTISRQKLIHQMQQELQVLDETLVDIDGASLKPSQCYRLSLAPPTVLYNTNCPETLMEKIELIFDKYVAMMGEEAGSVTKLDFTYQGRNYQGWFRPSQREDIFGKPLSFAVILNDTFFGHFSYNYLYWYSSEEIPKALVQLIGQQIQILYVD